MSNPLNTQIDGDHYKDLPIQPMEFSYYNGLDALQHTAIKYIVRFREKGGLQDLKKAKHVLDMLIELEYPSPNGNPVRVSGVPYEVENKFNDLKFDPEEGFINNEHS